VGTVIVANTIAEDLRNRLAEEAGPRRVLHLPPRCGEPGAAGAPIAAALAEVLTRSDGGSKTRRLEDPAPPGVLVISRDPAGGTAALVFSRRDGGRGRAGR
jgi:hypothetical protein